ncbi:hypothetical protein L9F63_023259, partial [Diploptera punctata]
SRRITTSGSDSQEIALFNSASLQPLNRVFSLSLQPQSSALVTESSTSVFSLSLQPHNGVLSLVTESLASLLKEE